MKNKIVTLASLSVMVTALWALPTMASNTPSFPNNWSSKIDNWSTAKIGNCSTDNTPSFADNM